VVIAVSVLDVVELHRDGERIGVRPGKTTEVLVRLALEAGAMVADLLKFIRDRRIRNVVWITADVHYCAAHHYDPARARFTEFDPFWEFVAGPLHAGTFGPGRLDDTFGPEARFVPIPAGAEMVIAYDPQTGRELWRANGVQSHPIPSFVAGHGLVFATAGSSAAGSACARLPPIVPLFLTCTSPIEAAARSAAAASIASPGMTRLRPARLGP